MNGQLVLLLEKAMTVTAAASNCRIIYQSHLHTRCKLLCQDGNLQNQLLPHAEVSNGEVCHLQQQQKWRT